MVSCVSSDFTQTLGYFPVALTVDQRCPHPVVHGPRMPEE